MILIAILITTALTGSAMADTYSNFKSLAAHRTMNVDYRIIHEDTASSTAVIAIHGGSIEHCTTEIASAVAAQGGYDLYSFVGLNSPSSLHITSSRFDEPTGRSLVAKSDKTLSIHGCAGSIRPVTYIGGLDYSLREKVKDALQTAGFKVAAAPPGLLGTARFNICNCNSVNKGVQLELSSSIRRLLAKNDQAFNLYVTALTNVLK